MPYAHHPSCSVTRGDDAKIWRYMDLVKLLSILVDRTLFFPSARTLAKSDPYEGRPTDADWQLTRTSWEDVPDILKKVPGINPGLFKLYQETQRERIENAAGFPLDIIFLSCWHANEGESDAMWKLYARIGDGIAIKSSISRLKASFAPASQEIFISDVAYVDTATHLTPPGSFFTPMLQKISAYSHENEVRCLVIDVDTKMLVRETASGRILSLEESLTIQESWRLRYGKTPPSGTNIAIDVHALIEKIHIAPAAPDWVLHVIETVLQKLEYKIPIEKSPLLSPVSFDM